MTTPSTPSEPTRPRAPSVREIAALTARLRVLTAPGAGDDPAQRAAFLAEKDALLERIVATQGQAPGPVSSAVDARFLIEGDRFEQDGAMYVVDDVPIPHDGVLTVPTRAGQDATWIEVPDGAWVTLHDRPTGGPVPTEAGTDEAVTRAEVVERLVGIGHDRASAQTMLAEYLDDTSRTVGAPVHQWGLDQHDVDVIAETYRWVDRYRGESLTEARERATRETHRWTEHATTATSEDPDRALRAQSAAARWADRARVPDPVTHDHDRDKHDDEMSAADLDDCWPAGSAGVDLVVAVDGPSTGALVEQAHAAVAGLPEARTVCPDQPDRRDQLATWHSDDQAGAHGDTTDAALLREW